MQGLLKCGSVQAGNTFNFQVATTGVATFPIGDPTFVTDKAYPELGRVAYSTSTGLGVTQNTTPSEAISKVDAWIDTYLLDAPPALGLGTATPAVESLTMTWVNPAQKKLAFTDAYLPKITTLKADIVPSANNMAQDWTDVSKWTMTIQTPTSVPTATTLRIVLDFASGTSNLTGNVYSFFGTTTATRILKEVAYDIRLYAENEATTSGEKVPRYIYYLNQATLSSGVPAAPTGLAVNTITTTGALADWSDLPDADRDIATTATPVISQYRVNVDATTSVRFGGALTTHPTPQLTSVGTVLDAPSTLSLTLLNPGTSYNIAVQARNALNVSFGAASTPPVPFTTTLPTAPAYASSTGLTLTNQASLVYPTGAGGFTLDGATARAPILRYNTLLTTLPRSSNVANVRINSIAGDTSIATGNIQAFAGVSGSEPAANVTTVGFGRSFVSPQGVSELSARVFVTAEGDAYTGSSNGFFKVASVYAEAIAPSTYYRASNSPYSMFLRFNPTGASTVTTNALNFFVDELNALPAVVGSGITAVSPTIQFVTGVPTFLGNSTFSFQATISDVCHQFLRNDKRHLSASIESTAGNALSSPLIVTKDTVTGNAVSYYAPPAQLYQISSTKHNGTGATLLVNPGNIQFRDSTITLSGANNVYFEALRLRVTPSNLVGDGTASLVNGHVDPATGNTSPIRIDTASVTALAVLGGTNTGTLMTPGSGQFPASGFDSVYDHTATIVGTDQLQLVNGRWQSKASAGYVNYSAYYFPGAVVEPDYSGIASTGFRYTCLRFQNLKGSGTYDSVTLGISSSSGLAITPANDTANFQVFLKVVGATTTPWVSGTVSINPSGYAAITTDGQGAMDNSAASTSSIRIFVPTGTPANATVYLRFGLNMAIAQSAGGLTITAN